MKYFTFGKETDPLVVILHGGGTSYRGAEPTARLLGERFRVVLVAYDGFNPTEPDTEFKSVMDEAKRVGDYVVEHHRGKIDVLYGISFGCRVLMEVLKDERLTITATIADGMSLREYPDIRSKVGKDVYCFF
ncbi:MAG: alpha/beta hydrolase, partial [Clostridia bacterium]|nr:alpha/beta hydrolase [Clostridia bacterium]